MSEQEPNPAIQAALKETEEAKKRAQEAAERFKSIEESRQRKLPLTPKQTLPGRQAEEVKQRKVQVKELERKPPSRIQSFLAPKKKEGRTLRDAIRERYGGKPRQMSTRVRTSRGSQVYSQGRVVESSGRISPELNTQKAERLASLRDKIRMFQNRKELVKLEQIWRRTRAQRPTDPELRP